MVNDGGRDDLFVVVGVKEVGVVGKPAEAKGQHDHHEHFHNLGNERKREKEKEKEICSKLKKKRISDKLIKSMKEGTGF